MIIFNVVDETHYYKTHPRQPFDSTLNFITSIIVYLYSRDENFIIIYVDVLIVCRFRDVHREY